MLADLDNVAREWDEMSEGERVAWSIDWSNEMSGLEVVARDVTAGAIGDEQAQRLSKIVRGIDRASSILIRLGLEQPNFDVSAYR